MKPFIILSFLILVAATARGEELLSRRLSVTFYETPIRQALDDIAKLADFEWSYNAGIVDANRRVTLTARDWTVREVLREMLGDGYAFKNSGRYLILKKQKPSKSELSGVVRDPKTGERLANVTVYDRKTLRATTTDSSGYYKLKIKKSAEVVVARLGYRDTILQVSSLSPRYQKIELSPVEIPQKDTTTLPEFLRKSFQDSAAELEAFFNATRDKWHEMNVPDTFTRKFQISFLPYLGTNHILSNKVENMASLNVLAGQSAGVRGIELGGLGNFTKKEVEGVQVAGLFNVNRGNTRGVQVGGLYNQTADTLEGIQVGGLLNVAECSPVLMTQVAGLVNIIHSRGSDAGSARGIQVSGLLNKADDINGIQVAGLVNRAKKVRGIQLGLVNHTDRLQGVQIGLVNRSEKRWMIGLNVGW